MQNGAAASLVRSPATSLYANQYHPFENPSLIDSEVQLQPFPTPEQQAGLNELLVFDDEKIVAWLTVLRSIEPGFRYQARRGCLSNQQLDALSTLIDCGDSDILTWLALSRFASDDDRQRKLNSTTYTSRSPFVSTSRHYRRPSTNPSLRSSTSSLAHSTVFSSNSSYGTPRSSLGRGIPLPELPEEFTRNDEPKHKHWCTYGDHPKPTTTCEGWKRHEREHESGYLCMPQGPVVNTQHGSICVLCREDKPDVDHQAWHNISACVEKSTKKSRRSDMITHLVQQHRVHSQVGATLVDQWRYDSNKKYLSCGFCVAIFPSILERSNHIDNEHWKNGQNMDSWELNLLIRGLLLEPGVQAAWRVLLRSYPSLIESNLRWEVPSAKGLQLRLEKSDEPGPVLAKAALDLSNYGRIGPDLEGLKATTGGDEMIFGAHSAGLPSPATTTVPLAPLGSSSLIDLGSSRTHFQEPRSDPLPNPSAFLNNSFHYDDFHSDHFLLPDPLKDQNISEFPSHLPAYAFPTDWPSMDTSHQLDDNARIQDHLSESGALLVAQMSSTRHGHPAANTPVNEQGQNLDPRNHIDTFNAGGLVPTSQFSHGLRAQLLNRKKPLPPLPAPSLPETKRRGAEQRPPTPMDLGTG